MKAFWLRSIALAHCLLLPLVSTAADDDWAVYGHDLGGTRYSPLAQITPKNIHRLQQAWVFHTGDFTVAFGDHVRSGFETTPLLVDGRLLLTTAYNRIVALDPATGGQLWAYDPKINRSGSYGDGLINRGLAAWVDASAAGRPCAARVFEATIDARLVAIDAQTGGACADFGLRGQVDLSAGVRNYHGAWYHMTSPPIVLDGVIVVGSAINDNTEAEMPDGVVRGFDAHTGKLLWSWEPLERPVGLPDGAWRTGAANAWSILSADGKLHLIYVPTGSASPDYYGGLRPGDNHWANSVVALDSRTGKLAWGFQLVHHDLWDYDTAAAPLVTTMSMHGEPTPVLVAGNKTGRIYVLDPSTGHPVLPVEERPAPASTLAGERASPTQPFPTATPMLGRQSLPVTEAWGLTDKDRQACQADLAKLSGVDTFSPPSTQGVLAVPGNIGGINWSGFAWDRKHERLIVAVTNLPFRVQMIPAAQFAAGNEGDFRGETAPQRGAAYAMVRAPSRSPSGLPCSPPPWGELVLSMAATSP